MSPPGPEVDYEAVVREIQKCLPGSLHEHREDLVQEISILVLEGAIDPKWIADGITKHLPALKRQYLSLAYGTSLDQSLRSDEPDGTTLGDITSEHAVLPKRRSRIGRPVTSKHVFRKCDECGVGFYFYHPGRKKDLGKKEQQRLRLLSLIHPKFWTANDVKLVRITDTLMFSKTGRGQGGIGKFCSHPCALKSGLPQKLPLDGTVERLYRSGWTTAQIAEKCGVSTRKAVREHLNKAGVSLRLHHARPASVKEPVADDFICMVAGCTAVVSPKIHAQTGRVYRCRCRECETKRRLKKQRAWRATESGKEAAARYAKARAAPEIYSKRGGL